MPASSASRPSTSRSIQVLGSLVLIIACLKIAKQVFIPLALAVLLTFILSPLVIRLQRRGLGRTSSVLLVVLITFTVLAGLCWGIADQLRHLLVEIPKHRDDIATKISGLKGTGAGPVAELVEMMNDITESVHGDSPKVPPGGKAPQQVVIVNDKAPSFSWFAGAVGPALEVGLSGIFMAILVVFMLAYREDLRNRFFRAVGHGHLTTTTRAVDEAAQRISRFLVTQLMINVGFGVLWALSLRFVPGGPQGLGVPYAFLWGCLAAALRFVPYIGTWVALAFPLVLSIALSPIDQPWLQPILLTAIFVALEMITGNVLEPLWFGHNTGVSPVALLVAAVFWAWLWGPIGLVLATPLTVCLVVFGKYVPQLVLFNVFLGSEAALGSEISYYQRLLARDEDEAADLVQAYLKERPLESVYDEVLLPALMLARRDEERGSLDPGADQFIREVTQRVMDEIIGQHERIRLVATGKGEIDATGELVAPKGGGKLLILGCPARAEEDELALRMLAQLLQADNYEMEVVSAQSLTSEVVARARKEGPAVICIAALPPGGVAPASYLCKRLRLSLPDVKIIVCRWGQKENLEKLQERLTEAGANKIVASLQETRLEVLPLVRVATGGAPSKDGAKAEASQLGIAQKKKK